MGFLFDLKRVFEDATGRAPSDAESRQLERALEDAAAEFNDSGDDSPDDKLRAFMDGGIPTVRLLSMRESTTCEACGRADGSEMKLAAALRKRPLPHADCSCDDGCGCVYLPVL